MGITILCILNRQLYHKHNSNICVKLDRRIQYQLQINDKHYIQVNNFYRLCYLTQFSSNMFKWGRGVLNDVGIRECRKTSCLDECIVHFFRFRF